MYKVNRQILDQITLIEEEMKIAGLWTSGAPDWVCRYQSQAIPDFWQWVQFVCLPFHKEGRFRQQEYLATQVTAHAGMHLSEHPLVLQRIVELDSLTSTLHHT